MASELSPTPENLRATYRLQFHEGFKLADALALVPYLSELGISHIYASPLLKACQHSQHGYDVCDPSQLNPELGTEADLEKLVLALREHKMGLVLDIVPNHMAATVENPWWNDVLKRGPDSAFAKYFDVDWEVPDQQTRGKVVLPVLGKPYAELLVEKQFSLKTAAKGHCLGYGENQFPVAEGSLPKDAPLEAINEDSAALDEIIRKQHYRLVFWQDGGAMLNYRRFFSIASLAGLRAEEPEVFDASHGLIQTWVKKGWIDGLRVDHPDGLRDPAGYLERLRRMAPKAWIVIEKILEPGESLPQAWPVSGTTGYDFMNRVNSIFVQTESEAVLTGFYSGFTGERIDYDELVRDKKRALLKSMFTAEVNRLLRILLQIASQDDRWRHFSFSDLHAVIVELAACFPVYRIYGSSADAPLRIEDQEHLREAVQLAAARQPQLTPDIFEMMTGLLSEHGRGDLAKDFAARFQQLTGPAMAKGVEDTAFYCFNRLLSLNEVGGNPGQFGSPVEVFHGFCATLQADWPGTMLATDTHDTKRGEDVRARLNVLSELPEEWCEAVRRWAAMNQCRRTGKFPDRNAEYLIFQTLAGAWPISERRLFAYVEKAIRESGQHTIWQAPDPGYEMAVQNFVIGLLGSPAFIKELEHFIARIHQAGCVNSLSQTLIKLTAPGIPDIYQGCELWNFSLVDPDNRRPVDFKLRHKMLARIKTLSASDVWCQEPLAKLWLIWKVLNFRASHPKLFSENNGYEPLSVQGTKKEHAVAFLRGSHVITIVPRLPRQLQNDWADTTLLLPEGEWLNVFTDEIFFGPVIHLKQLLAKFPVALLVCRKHAS